MSFSEKCCRVLGQATNAYHITNHIDATVHDPYEVKSIQKPGVNTMTVYKQMKMYDKK